MGESGDDMQPVRMPNHFDDQRQILFWDIDTLAVVIMFFIIGYVLRELTIMMVLAFFAGHLFSKWKTNQLNGVLIHLSYRFGWWRINDVFKNGNTKEWVD